MNDLDDQGRPTGLWEDRFTDGRLSGTGHFEDGEKTGEWTYWFKNGQLKAHGEYNHGKLDGPWVWYRAGGGLLQAGSFVDGLQDGLWTRHHASGEVLDSGMYAAGKKIGEWVRFNPNGQSHVQDSAPRSWAIPGPGLNSHHEARRRRMMASGPMGWMGMMTPRADLMAGRFSECADGHPPRYDTISAAQSNLLPAVSFGLTGVSASGRPEG